jgi:hypothetical protein
MATNTYDALLTYTIPSTAASYTFTAIPSGYTDLILIGNATTAVANGSITLQFNGDTANNYSYTFMLGTGSAPFSSRASNAAIIGFMGYGAQVPIGTRAMGIAHIHNYSNTSVFKTVLIRNTPNVSATTEAAVGIWRSTSAINSITILPISGASLAAGSTFSLYGIRAEGVSPAPKATGGAIYDDELYYYHVFGQTGVFTPAATLSCDYVIVAGGGGSGYGTGGGGGAGGFRSFTSQTLSATNYPVTIGGGGSGSGGANTAGGDGTNSSFNSLSSTGGGGGGSQPGSGAGSNGRSGGSGGGASRSGSSYSGGAGNLGGYTPVEGFGGGNNQTAASNGCGGGGGAGGAGASGTTTADGAGGIGATSSLVTAIVSATGVGQLVSGVGYLAGGGGGGGGASGTQNGAAGGLGGGAQGGANLSVGNNGTVNTGGGAGGAGFQNGGRGGSGVVIVRYLKA